MGNSLLFYHLFGRIVPLLFNQELTERAQIYSITTSAICRWLFYLTSSSFAMKCRRTGGAQVTRKPRRDSAPFIDCMAASPI